MSLIKVEYFPRPRVCNMLSHCIRAPIETIIIATKDRDDDELSLFLVNLLIRLALC
jgi:hypothetical protein